MEIPNSRKRKRQTISLAEKQAIIEASKTRTTAQLVTYFNSKYKYTTIGTILKSKDKIEKAIDDGANGKRAFSRAVKFPTLEETLLKWLKDVRSQNVAVDGPMLKEKALAVAKLLKIDENDFKASEGWLTGFKDRHGIFFQAATRRSR